jgi:hypothetical protein
MNRLISSALSLLQITTSFVNTDPWCFSGGAGEGFVPRESTNPFVPSIGTRLTALSIQTLIVLSVIVPILSVIR